MPAQSPPPAAHPFSNPGGTQPVSSGLTPSSQSISESPVVRSPSGKTSSTGKPSASGGINKGRLFFLLALLIIVVVGTGGLYYLRSLQEEPPPTVVTPPESRSTARITLEPASGTLDGGTPQNIQFSLDLSNTPVDLSALAFAVNFAGSVPADIGFVADPSSPLPVPQTAVTDTETGKSLVVTYPLSETLGIISSKISLGTLQFTSLESGQLNIRFDSAGSKVIISPGSVDILRPPSIISYTFRVAVPGGDATASAQSSTSTASAQLAQIAVTPTVAATSAPGASVTVTATRTPTPRPSATVAAAQGVGGAATSPTATPTRTPTATPTTKATATPTATASASRSSSQPATSQSLPVSGDGELTIKTVGLGLLLLISGIVLWPKLRKPKHSSHE